MPMLKNVLHEKFCQEFVNGPNAGNAMLSYIAAGFAEHSAGSHSSRLRTRPHIAGRIAELVEERAGRLREPPVPTYAEAHAQTVTKRIITREAVIDELAAIAFAKVTDYLKVSADNKEVEFDLAALKRDEGRAIVQFMVFRDRDPTKPGFRFKLADKLGAMDRLVRYLGMFADAEETAQDHAGKSYEQLRSEVVGILNRVAERERDVRVALEAFGDGEETKPH